MVLVSLSRFFSAFSAVSYTHLDVYKRQIENYAKEKLRPSTFKTSQGFLKNHIKPQIGSISLADLTSLELQRFYKHLLDGGRVDRCLLYTSRCV